VSSNRGGETQGYRETIAKLTERLKRSGVPAVKAEREAIKTARRIDRGQLKQK
jgi:hypothetical protein